LIGDENYPFKEGDGIEIIKIKEKMNLEMKIMQTPRYNSKAQMPKCQLNLYSA